MHWFEIFGILVLSGIAWFWFDSARARESALRRARQECAAEGVQLLDETVSSARIGWVRDDDGRLALRRVYAFEYSDTGNNRRPGSIVLQGQEVLFVNIGQA